MEPFNFVGTDGRRYVFWLECGEDYLYGRRAWYFEIWPAEVHKPEDFPYEARFELLDDGRLQSSMLDNHGLTWALRIGLSEALFEEVGRRTKCRIVSSRKSGEDQPEYRTILAEKMWKRFQCSGRASYSKIENRYEFIPPGSPI
jgi:hypothetical protein